MPVTPKYTFEVGQEIEIKSWEEMVEEFGLSGHNIRCTYSFTDAMKPLCGRRFTINNIIGEHIFLNWGDERPRWNISTDMIKPVDDGIEPPSDESFICILRGM